MRAAAATVALLALLLAPLAVAQGPAPISVVSPAGRRSLPVTLVNGEEYVALDDVAAFLPLSVREDRQGGLVVTVRGRNIVAPRDRSLVSVDGRVVSLPGPLTRVGSRWLAPVDFVPRALGPIADQRVEYRRPSRLLLLGMVRVPRVTPRVEAVGGGARVTLEIAPPAGVTTVTETDRVVVRIDADALDLAPVSGVAAAVAQIRADPPATLTIALAPAAGDAKATTSTTDTAARVVIDVAAPGQAPDTSSAAPPQPAAPVPALLVPAAAGVRTVVIDPGHGGDDGGVKGPGGTLEKQITLGLAKRLKSVLEARMGVHVVLTRDDDRVVTLDERTAAANNAKGHLFLSLHMNGSPSPAHAGPAVFFMRLDREGEDTRREAGAQAQALPVLGGGTRVIETIRWDLAQVRHIESSQRLATLLAGALAGRGGAALPPVQPAPLRVLAGLDMPAVLFEMGYLTNAAQEKAVAADDLRGTLVQAIYDAVNRFATEPAPCAAAGAASSCTAGTRAAVKRTAFFGLAGFTALALLAWGVNSGLQYLGRTSSPEVPVAAPPAATPTARITATLFYGAPDGVSLAPVRVDVPLAEGAVAQGRHIVQALLQPPPAPYLAVIPAGTTLKALYLTPGGDAFVDLSAEVSTRHPGGTQAELLTVYAIVNAVTTNLRGVRRVQLLIDGREADTVGGHVDVRRPLELDASLVRQEPLPAVQ